MADAKITELTLGTPAATDVLPYVDLSGGTTKKATVSSLRLTAVAEEVPVDSGDQTNFTIAHAPSSGTFRLYRGGARIQNTVDYTLSGTTITLAYALASGEVLICDYAY
jgi:hypothetical protein